MGAMKKYIAYFDSGTSNTRLYLLDENMDLVDLSKETVGSKDSAVAGTNKVLLSRLKEMYDRALERQGLREEQIRTIYASGMSTSPYGIKEYPHQTIPISIGYLWHKDFCFIAVRKSRYTLPFIQRAKSFSLNFFAPQYRDAMQYCGTVSGRDEDKIAHCGFTVNYQSDIPYLEQASLVLQCRTMYSDDIEPRHFVNPEIFQRWYKGGKHEGDMHVFFLGEIVKAFEVQR